MLCAIGQYKRIVTIYKFMGPDYGQYPLLSSRIFAVIFWIAFASVVYIGTRFLIPNPISANKDP